MNRRAHSLYLLLALAAVACGREGRTGRDTGTVTVNRTWPAAAIRELEVFEIDGSVTVDAVAGNEISLVAKASGDLELKPGEENQGLFETSLDGQTLRIGRREHRRSRGFDIDVLFGRDDMEIDYVLRVPASVSL